MTTDERSAQQRLDDALDPGPAVRPVAPGDADEEAAGDGDTWGDPAADAGLLVDDPASQLADTDPVLFPSEPTPDDPDADPGDIPAIGGSLPA